MESIKHKTSTMWSKEESIKHKAHVPCGPPWAWKKFTNGDHLVYFIFVILCVSFNLISRS